MLLKTLVKAQPLTGGEALQLPKQMEKGFFVHGVIPNPEISL